MWAKYETNLINNVYYHLRYPQTGITIHVCTLLRIKSIIQKLNWWNQTYLDLLIVAFYIVPSSCNIVKICFLNIIFQHMYIINKHRQALVQTWLHVYHKQTQTSIGSNMHIINKHRQALVQTCISWTCCSQLQAFYDLLKIVEFLEKKTLKCSNNRHLS